MAVMITCEDCGRRLRVPDRSLGKTVRCPDCRKEVLVPRDAEAGPAGDGVAPAEKTSAAPAEGKQKQGDREQAAQQDGKEGQGNKKTRRVTRKFSKPPVQRAPVQQPAVPQPATTVEPAGEPAAVAARSSTSVTGYAARRRSGPSPLLLAAGALLVLAGIGGVVYLVATYNPTVAKPVAQRPDDGQRAAQRGASNRRSAPVDDPSSSPAGEPPLPTVDPDDATPSGDATPAEPGSGDGVAEVNLPSSGSPPFVPPGESPFGSDGPPTSSEPPGPATNPTPPVGPQPEPPQPAPQPKPPAPAPGNPAAAAPAPQGPPDLLCERCRGMGVVPLEKFRPYVVVEGDGRPKPEAAVRAAYCPKCQADRDPQMLVDIEDARLKIAGPPHLEWERKTKFQLTRVETHHVTVHAQLPPQEARKVGLALEVMAAHLQKLFGTMEFTRTTPDTFELIILWTKPNYLQFIKMWEREFPDRVGDDWHLVPELAGVNKGNVSFFYESPNTGRPPAHMAVFMTAGRQMDLATSYHRSDWLREGFCAYCENVVMRKNLVHSVSYMLNNVKIGPDWALEARRFAAAGRLRPWDDMFRLELRDYQAIEHLTAYAMVYFLIQSDPARFRKFVELVGQEKSDEEALQAAYGQGVPQLQAACLRWLMGRR